MPTLIAYQLSLLPTLRLIPAPHLRAWMEETRSRFANRCLPMLLANQAGWFLLNNQAIRATWDGGDAVSAMRLEFLSDAPADALKRRFGPKSHFGHGILTWHIPYLFRTPAGWNLLARGPANSPKDGVFPLEGLVETDWTVATFTMNWKFTAMNRPIMFDEDEPICMIVPQRRGALEAFRPQTRDIWAEPEVRHAYLTWVSSRSQFLADRPEGEVEAAKRWQRHYFRGMALDGTSAPVHQTQLKLSNFEVPCGSTLKND